MSGALLGAIAGLAALDAFNPATIVAVTLILLVAPSRPGLTALVTILGAATTVFVAGAALFLGASAAAGAVGGIVLALRYVAFGAAGAAVVIAGVRRFRTRPCKAIELPAWFTPWTAFPFWRTTHGRYCLPCLVLLVIGLLSRQRTHALLARITNRLGTGDVPASHPAAIALMTLGLFVGTLPLWALS